jgi:hypothetical protein
MASTEAPPTTNVEKDAVQPAGGAGGVNGAPDTAAYDYGGHPMAHIHSGPDARLPAFGGELQPGLYRSVESLKIANPGPLGLSAFALTTFVLSLVNMGTRGLAAPNIAVPLAYGYGGLVQLLAGMWEMAVGNTFGATALSSYGGFWLAYAVLQTPSLGIASNYDATDLASAVGFFLTGWFIFTTVILLCTLRSTVMFFLLFFTLDMAFLFLAVAEYAVANGSSSATRLQQAGGGFGILAAFLAWYNAFAGIADSSNSFFLIPVFHFPWSEKGRENRLNRVSSVA